MDDEPKQRYELSEVICAHDQDVRCLSATNDGALLSGSRDETLRLFVRSDGKYKQESEWKNFAAVHAVAIYYTSPESLLVFCGRKDGTIAIFNSAAFDSNPSFTIKDHTSPVAAIKINQETGQLITGGWDHHVYVYDINAIIADTPAQQFALTGHSHSVWAVDFMPEHNHFLTASADKTIKLWVESNALRTFSGHTDVVRSLVVLNPHKFLSAANDGTLRLWDVESGKSETYESIPKEYIYSMIKLEVGDEKLILTSGERGYVEIFSLVADDCALVHRQLIRTPATSAWALIPVGNGDFAVASNLGIIYIFTTNAERRAPQVAIEAFDADVAAQVAVEDEQKKAHDNDVVTIKVSLDDNAPQHELKYTKGTDPADAAEIFLKENNLPSYYLDEIIQFIKTNVPEAANFQKYAAQRPTRTQAAGKYDYVFDVDAGGNSLKLGYNVGEDPDMAAQRFCEENKLPIKFIPQLNALLRSEVPELKGLAAFADPFTGGGRYVPGQSSAAGPSNGGDPFTGSGRYIPGQSSAVGAVSGADPLTGGGRYIPGSGSSAHALTPNSLTKPDKHRPRSELVPVRQFYTFGYEGVASKALDSLRDANARQQPDQMLEEPLLDSLLDILQNKPSESAEIQCMALEKGLSWPLQDIVPILDVFRLALLNESINNYFCSTEDNRGLQTLQKLSAFLISEPAVPVRILVCRCLANACKHEAGREMVSRNMTEVTDLIVKQLYLQDNKPAVQVAAASFIANISLILLRRTERGECTELGPREDILRAIIKHTETVFSFGTIVETALLRLMQAVVTLMWGDTTVIEMAKQRGISEIANRIKDAVADEPSKAVARDIFAMVG